MEYNSSKELYDNLNGAFNVKLRMINKNYDYIKKVDIWNYLKINKWHYDKNLNLSEMVNDIISVDIEKVDKFIKKHLKEEDRKIYTEE